ncbi:cupin-like domain-containing protein [Nostoc sp.]|uniref:cupin-like domain-containing protein n=1 Tax=Nostoc sp. TaxID=1180 RepID=UPI002FF66529
MIVTYSSIERRYRLSAQEFKSIYVDKSQPVIISGIIQDWDCFKKWSLEYFKKLAPTTRIYAKQFSSKNEIGLNHFSLEEYSDILENYEINYRHNKEIDKPPYCHDLPMFSLVPKLINDVTSFPLDYLPKWYWYEWWRYCQFFIGASNSLTPLHFDCLLTNNIFFQIVGQKQFTILLADHAKYCYRYNWRWFKVDPENPDLDKYPEYKNAQIIQFILNPGDILYMPPGTLHHVRSLDTSISFNIDWHTQKSCLNGLAASLKGMPAKNVYYNFLLTLGLVFKLPPKLIFRYYKTYLNYIS